MLRAIKNIHFVSITRVCPLTRSAELANSGVTRGKGDEWGQPPQGAGPGGRTWLPSNFFVVLINWTYTNEALRKFF